MPANRLYFAQHGLAIDKADDPERPLSKPGIEQTKGIATHLQRSAIPLSQIFHSGKLRAAQTAEIIASICGVESISVIDNLSPNDDVTLTEKELNINDALYVGHLPHLEKLIAYLVTGNKDENIFKFKNSAIVCLEKSDYSYQIKWTLSPDWLPR